MAKQEKVWEKETLWWKKKKPVSSTHYFVICTKNSKKNTFFNLNNFPKHFPSFRKNYILQVNGHSSRMDVFLIKSFFSIYKSTTKKEIVITTVTNCCTHSWFFLFSFVGEGRIIIAPIYTSRLFRGQCFSHCLFWW